MRKLVLSLLTALCGSAQVQVDVPADIQADLDVEYSRVGERVAMDIFRPKNAVGPHPAILCVHGGGFRAGSRAGYRALAIKLAQRGYVAATASYRLAPRHQFPAAVEDVKAAVRFLRANAKKYALDPEHIGATGGSAGGHLVLMLGLTGDSKAFDGYGPNLDQSAKVQAVVNYFGLTDFTRSYGKSVDTDVVLPLWLGGDLEHERRYHQIASPLNYANPLAAPLLSVHGTEDKYVEHAQSVWLTERLQAMGAEAELLTLPGAGHGFEGADAEKAEAALFAFFDKHLRPKNQRKVLISDHGPKGEIVLMNWPSGQELARYPNGRGHDVQPLPDGHVLYTVAPEHKVVEVDASGKRVWECCEGLDHPLAAQRLPGGNTLIGDARLGKVIEVDKAGKTVWQYASEDIANMRMRNSKRTAAGTTLICVEAVAKVIEVDRAGKIVWTWQAPGDVSKRRLYQAWRLPNGNTRMTISDPGEVVEVNPKGEIVRSIAGGKMDIQMGWTSGHDQFPNGNLFLSDYTGRRLLEIDQDGKVVNQLRTGPRTVASVAVVP
ncbi:MAG: alpha/beta hydrolase fold domain-containing protein [Acidobacteria bacterium]|nr:alpha/beta hydrolase fold domain-containing protein [Acidobacteriota bacterium]